VTGVQTCALPIYVERSKAEDYLRQMGVDFEDRGLTEDDF